MNLDNVMVLLSLGLLFVFQPASCSIDGKGKRRANRRSVRARTSRTRRSRVAAHSHLTTKRWATVVRVWSEEHADVKSGQMATLPLVASMSKNTQLISMQRETFNAPH